MDICGMDDLINKFYFLSHDGAFPSRSNNGQINVNNYKFEALNKNASITENRFWRQLKNLEEMKALGKYCRYYKSYIKIINGLVVKLSPYEQKIFV
jgi:hypothetical protein